MSLHFLKTSARLITDVDPVIINLCQQLSIKTTWIILEHDHMFIAGAQNIECLFLTTSSRRTNEDVYTTPEIFLEILLDITSGTPAKLAYEKQGYTF